MGARPVIALADAFLDEAEMYEASLRHEGFDVRMLTTLDVVVAAAQVHAIAPDAVLTRILPRRFGIELVTLLRRNPIMAERPLFILTSLSHHEAELRDARACGATDVLLLPQSTQDLARLIRRCLRHPPRKVRPA